ncbi:MAG: hypothetical protein KDD40_03260 [Bdellovibrionales bacterium]|nr:hypothetical protein [Bdellovibrionales bacterium]
MKNICSILLVYCFCLLSSNVHANYKEMWALQLELNSEQINSELQNVGFNYDHTPTQTIPKHYESPDIGEGFTDILVHERTIKLDPIYTVQGVDGTIHRYSLDRNAIIAILKATKTYGKVHSFKFDAKNMSIPLRNGLSWQILPDTFLSFGPDYKTNTLDYTDKSEMRAFGWKQAIDQIEDMSDFRLVSYSFKSPQERESYHKYFITFRFEHLITKDIVETILPDRLKDALATDPYATLMNSKDLHSQKEIEQDLGWQFIRAYFNGGEKTYKYLDTNGIELFSKLSPQEISSWHYNNHYASTIAKTSNIMIITKLLPEDLLALQYLLYQSSHLVKEIVVIGKDAQLKTAQLRSALIELHQTAIQVHSLTDLEGKNQEQLLQITKNSNCQQLLPFIGLEQVGSVEFLQHFHKIYEIGHWITSESGQQELIGPWDKYFLNLVEFLDQLPIDKGQSLRWHGKDTRQVLNLIPQEVIADSLGGKKIADMGLENPITKMIMSNKQPIFNILTSSYPQEQLKEALSDANIKPLLLAMMAINKQGVLQWMKKNEVPTQMKFKFIEKKPGVPDVLRVETSGTIRMIAKISKDALKNEILNFLKEGIIPYYEQTSCEASLTSNDS